MKALVQKTVFREGRDGLASLEMRCTGVVTVCVTDCF